jgi:adenylate cyclase
MSRVAKAAALGLLSTAVALVLSLLPFGLDLEESLGLQLLFSIRGARPAPSDVVVVSLDRLSAEALDLPADPARWPRSLHGQLTDVLARAGARVIVFDIFFDQPREAKEDAAFAAAMERAGTVILSKYLSRETLGFGNRTQRRLNVERLLAPHPLLGRAALASAPFPLPKVPVRVNQYWTFKTGADDAPTLPAVALHVYTRDVHQEFRRIFSEFAPAQASMLPRETATLSAKDHIETSMRVLRGGFAAEPALADRMLEAIRKQPLGPDAARRLGALVRLYQSADSEYLDFYGPPRTLATLPYHVVVSEESLRDPGRLGVEGKAVFVGLSEYLRPEQKDGFHTVFSENTGVDLSGVEIAATAFGNLVEGRHLRSLGITGHVVLFVTTGVTLGVLCTRLAPMAAAAGVVVAALLYLGLAEYEFAEAGVWYPVMIPLLLQLPVAFVGSILWRYADTNRERQKMRTALSHYVPASIIDQVVSSVGSVRAGAERVYGICLATDAERYTSLAESVELTELSALLNRYYATVFEPVKRHGGIISDVVGDATLALWVAHTEDAALRERACEAACEMANAVDKFNRSAGTRQLPTRIGLHSGEMMLGNVGAIDHYEYRAVGDIVNTASRIQGLNKYFATRILASEEVVRGLDTFLTPRLGTFLLAGKLKPIAIHQLICPRREARPEHVGWARLFSEALAAYEAQAWQEAREQFASIITCYGEDGASRFYLDSCERYRARPPQEWDGVIRMEAK